MLTEARRLDSYGFNVLPADRGDKSPTVPWKKWVGTRATHMIGSWFGSRPQNYWIATGGVSGVYVLDIDNEAADKWWREVVGFGADMDATVAVATAKGHHYYFWVPPTDGARGWARHDETVDFDIRGAGGGVIAPPSVHQTGFKYAWVREPDLNQPMMGMVAAPDWMKSAEGVAIRIAEKTGRPVETPTETFKTVSMLSSLLEHPPKEGGRNDWLTKVCGHYAKTYRRQNDLYLLHARRANQMLTTPLDRAEFEKTVNSVWESEFANHSERGMSEDSGWLLAGGDRILTQAEQGKGEDKILTLAQWSDFDLRVAGVIRSEEDPGNVIYDCRLRRQRDSADMEVLIPGKVLGDSKALVKFLAGYGATISRPDHTVPRNPPDPVRLQRYLESQEAPLASMAPHLGWHAAGGAFLTFDGVLRADGAHPFSGVRPDPRLREQGRARFNYGMNSGAQAILREVLTFHDPGVVSVFGAWWAATLLKPQLSAHTSLFPLMAIEAASGAGKTNGFFALMLQLAGGLAGATQGTVASSRDRISAHKSGIVWIDDLDSLERLHEILRATTSGETITKKGFDNTQNVNIPLVAPVVVSGEALGLGTQKALIDRVVAIAPNRPDGRRSLKPGREDQPQWNDIVELTSKYPLASGATGGESDGLGLSVFAGSLQVLALSLVDGATQRLIEARKELKKVSGRQAEKLAILVAGAWLLDQMSGSSEHEARVLAWCETAEAVNGSAGDWDNRLTTEILPWALQVTDWPTSARAKPAVFVEANADLLGARIWVNCMVLADMWAERRGVKIVERTDTQRAIRDQIQRADGKSKLFECGMGRGDRNQALYWSLEGAVAEVVLERSRG